MMIRYALWLQQHLDPTYLTSHRCGAGANSWRGKVFDITFQALASQWWLQLLWLV